MKNGAREHCELRFAVHDSPHFSQLKLSVLNDDKKADLVGEAWVDLSSIIRTGSGKKDFWLGLGCNGKRAGEIRLEITYHDIRSNQNSTMPLKSKRHDVNSASSPLLRSRRNKPPNSRNRGASGADGKISKPQRRAVQPEETVLDGSRASKLADTVPGMERRTQSSLHDERHSTATLRTGSQSHHGTTIHKDTSSGNSKTLDSLRSRILYWQNNVLSPAQRDELDKADSREENSSPLLDPRPTYPKNRSVESSIIDAKSSSEAGGTGQPRRDGLLQPLVPPGANTPPPLPTHQHMPVAGSQPGQPSSICTIHESSPLEADGLGLIPAPLSFAAKKKGEQQHKPQPQPQPGTVTQRREKQPEREHTSGSSSVVSTTPKQAAAWERLPPIKPRPRNMERQGSLLFSSAKRAEQRMHNRSPLVQHQQKRRLLPAALPTSLDLRHVATRSFSQRVEESSLSSRHGQSSASHADDPAAADSDDDDSPPSSPSLASSFPMAQGRGHNASTDSLAPNESASNLSPRTPPRRPPSQPEIEKRPPPLLSPDRPQPLVTAPAPVSGPVTKPPPLRPSDEATRNLLASRASTRRPGPLQLNPVHGSRNHPTSPRGQSPPFSIVKERVQQIEASPDSKAVFPRDVVPCLRHTPRTNNAPDKRRSGSPSRPSWFPTGSNSSPTAAGPTPASASASASALTTPVRLNFDQHYPPTQSPRPSPISPLRSSMEVDTALQRINEVEMAICKLRKIASAASPPLQQHQGVSKHARQAGRASCSPSALASLLRRGSSNLGGGGGGGGDSPRLRKSTRYGGDDADDDRMRFGSREVGTPQGMSPGIGARRGVGGWRDSEGAKNHRSGANANADASNSSDSGNSVASSPTCLSRQSHARSRSPAQKQHETAYNHHTDANRSNNAGPLALLEFGRLISSDEDSCPQAQREHEQPQPLKLLEPAPAPSTSTSTSTSTALIPSSNRTTQPIPHPHPHSYSYSPARSLSPSSASMISEHAPSEPDSCPVVIVSDANNINTTTTTNRRLTTVPEEMGALAGAGAERREAHPEPVGDVVEEYPSSVTLMSDGGDDDDSDHKRNHDDNDVDNSDDDDSNGFSTRAFL